MRQIGISALLFAGVCVLQAGCVDSGSSGPNGMPPGMVMPTTPRQVVAASASTRQTQGALHTFQAGSQPAWQMVSAPFTLGQTFSSMGIFADVWQPAANQYASTPTPPADTFHLGQGYWVLVTQNIPISGTTSPVPAGPFTIPLQFGWNQVGEPFNTPVPLSNMAIVTGSTSTPLTTAIANAAVSPLYTFDPVANQYNTLSTGSQTFNPWDGAWLFTFNAASLVITPPVSTPPPTASIPVANDASASSGFSFSPATVKSGASVTWSNRSAAPHSVLWDSRSPATAPAPGANIPIFNGGATSAAWTAPTVTTTTNYNYHCGVHGPMMSGIVTVTP